MEIEIKDSGRKMPLLNLDRIFDTTGEFIDKWINTALSLEICS